MTRPIRSGRVSDDREVVEALDWAERAAAARAADVVTDVDALAGLLATSASARQLLADAGVDLARLRERLAADTGEPQDAVTETWVFVPPPSAHLQAGLEGARRRALRRGASLATPADLLQALAGLTGASAAELLAGTGADSRHPAPPRPRPQPAGPGDLGGVIAQRREPGRRLVRVTKRSWQLATPAGKGLFELLKTLLQTTSDSLATLVFLPGVLTLVGLRGVIGLLQGLPVTHGNLLGSFGGELEIAGDRRRHWQRASILLLPHLLLVGIGAVLLTSYLVQFAVLGVSPLPAVTASPQLLVSKNLGWPVTVSALTTYGPLDLVRLWTGLACWFCAAPGYVNVKAGRQELAQVVSKRRRGAGLARVVAWMTAPLQWVSRLLKVFDDAVLWFGGNVLIASGGVTLLVLFVAELRFIAFLLT
jgi:hypothetical protein